MFITLASDSSASGAAACLLAYMFWTLYKRATLVTHLINFSFEYSYMVFTENALSTFSILWCKKSQKMTKNSNQGVGSCLQKEVKKGKKSKETKDIIM